MYTGFVKVPRDADTASLVINANNVPEGFSVPTLELSNVEVHLDLSKYRL